MMPAVSRTPEAAHHAILGAGLKLWSVLCFSGMAACVKALGPAVPPGQVVFVRGLISMLVIGAVAAAHRGHPQHRPQPPCSPTDTHPQSMTPDARFVYRPSTSSTRLRAWNGRIRA